jgi:putative hydrolase of HD superfamily
VDPTTVPFVLRALALKDAPRRGWLRAGVARPESVADHSWGVALLAAVATPEGLDRARVLELAALHDLAEAAVGDLVPGEYASKEEKLALERRGLEGLLAEAPDALRARLLADFDELASDASPEARFVHELDKLEMAFQARRHEDAGVPRAALEPYRASARKGVTTPALAAALNALEDER